MSGAALTVCCVLADGPVSGYSPDYVTRLEQMVRRHLQRPFRFVCLTDGTRGHVHGEVIQIPRVHDDVPSATRGIWQKIHVFNPGHGFQGRVLYLDLDTIVVSDLAPIVDDPRPIAFCADDVSRGRYDIDRYGRIVVRQFNTSVMVFDPPVGARVAAEWSLPLVLRYSTDQDWLGDLLGSWPGDKGLPYEWFPRISQVRPPWPPEAKVVLCKKPKNHEAVQQWPELTQWWGAA